MDAAVRASNMNTINENGKVIGTNRSGINFPFNKRQTETFDEYARRKAERPYKFSKIRQQIRGIRGYRGQITEAQIRNMYNRGKIQNTNLRRAILNARKAEMNLHSQMKNAADAWARNSVALQKFDPVGYKRYRQYYISALNRAAGFSTRGTSAARFYDYGKKIKATASNFTKGLGADVTGIGRYLRNLKMSAAKGGRLAGVRAARVLNRPVAYLGARFPTKSNAALEFKLQKLEKNKENQRKQLEDLLAKIAKEKENRAKVAAAAKAAAALERNVNSVNNAALRRSNSLVAVAANVPKP